MIQESVNKSQTGTFIKDTEEGLQLELGLNTTIATVSWKTVKLYLTPTWYSDLIEFVLTFDGYQEDIEIIEDVQSIPLLNKNNSFILLPLYILSIKMIT